ncbi:MAG: hypothetical protein HY300_20930 [Verrucomicrobia bacterium]|nr:hypothetical protein [Verrucomicrobiota bacterium]
MLLTLLVFVPLLTGLVCWPLRERAVLERLNLLAFVIVAALAVWLGAEVLASSTVEAFGGFLRVDALSALVVGLTAFVALACGIYAVGYLREEERAGKINARLLHRYYVLTPIFVGTMMAVPLVNNLGLLWVAIESTTLASVLLVRFYNQKSSLEAAWKYMIIGSAGIALALFGTVLTYFSAVPVLGEHAENGFNWSVLFEVADKCQPAAMRLGFVMVLVGYGTKAGLAPMHTWKPDAYAEAPVPSAALLGAGFINCAIYGIMRFYTLAAKCLGHDYAGNLLVLFGVASMRAGRHAAHAFPCGHEAAHVFLRRQRPATFRHTPFPQGYRRYQYSSAHGRTVYYGHAGGDRHAALQHFSKRIHGPERRACSRSTVARRVVCRWCGHNFRRVPRAHLEAESWRGQGQQRASPGMPMETQRDAAGHRACCRSGMGAAAAALSTRP